VQIGRVQRLGELPRVHRRRADVARLAGLDDVVERLERLLDRRAVVPAVDLVEVDVVHAQAAKAVVDLGHDRSAGQAAAVGALMHLAVDLGGDHHLVAPGEVGQRVAEDLLAGAGRVDVGGVEEVDALLERAPDEPAALLGRQRPRVSSPGGLPEAHAPEADARDVQAGASKFDVIHGSHFVSV
jgi:hypothetical protein